MSVRMHCRACRTAFVTKDDPAVRAAVCPKCGEKQPRVKTSSSAPATVKPQQVESVFVPSDEEIERKPRRLRRVVIGLLGLAAVAGVGVVVALPYMKRKPVPVKPVDSVTATATDFLKALVEGKAETVKSLSTVDLPPAIRTFRGVKRDTARDGQLKGKFGPVAAFHTKVNETYAYDESAGRFTPKNALGPAAETLDALHEAKAKAEKDGIYKKMQSGNPDDLFDAAEGLGKAMTALAEGALAPKKLVPTYAMLIDDAKPPLPPMEKALVLEYANHRETWDQLLKRPFMTLKADGPYLLERAEVTAMVTDSLGSDTDPPSPLSLTLTRFRFEGIDTGWKVTATRRGKDSGEPRLGPAVEQPAAKKSPGETTAEPSKAGEAPPSANP